MTNENKEIIQIFAVACAVIRNDHRQCVLDGDHYGQLYFNTLEVVIRDAQERAIQAEGNKVADYDQAIYELAKVLSKTMHPSKRQNMLYNTYLESA
jgi:hypothetical protein